MHIQTSQAQGWMKRAPRGALDEATGEERLFIFIKRYRQKNEKILISANTRNLLGLGEDLPQKVGASPWASPSFILSMEWIVWLLL